jgi:hypothetical protein
MMATVRAAVPPVRHGSVGDGDGGRLPAHGQAAGLEAHAGGGVGGELHGRRLVSLSAASLLVLGAAARKRAALPLELELHRAPPSDTTRVLCDA